MDLGIILARRIKYMYCLSNVIQKNKENGWKDVQLAVKSIYLISDALYILRNVLSELMNLAFTFEDYCLTVKTFSDIENRFGTVAEYCFQHSKEMLYKVIKEIRQLDMNYEEMEHLVYTHFLIENYKYVELTEHDYLIEILLKSIEEPEVSIHSTYNKVSTFLDINSKYIEQFGNDPFISDIGFTLLCQGEDYEMKHRQLRSILKKATKTSINGEKYTIIDVIEKLSREIASLCY
jgi:hypothetical protein